MVVPQMSPGEMALIEYFAGFENEGITDWNLKRDSVLFETLSDLFPSSPEKEGITISSVVMFEDKGKYQVFGRNWKDSKNGAYTVEEKVGYFCKSCESYFAGAPKHEDDRLAPGLSKGDLGYTISCRKCDTYFEHVSGVDWDPA